MLVWCSRSTILVSGVTGKDLRTPYTALFEANGKLVKEIYEAEDEDARRKASGDTDFTHNASVATCLQNLAMSLWDLMATLPSHGAYFGVCDFIDRRGAAKNANRCRLWASR